MWRYGRGRARMVSIAEAERIRAERLSESRIRAAETRKRRSEAAAAAGGGEGGGGVRGELDSEQIEPPEISCIISYFKLYV